MQLPLDPLFFVMEGAKVSYKNTHTLLGTKISNGNQMCIAVQCLFTLIASACADLFNSTAH